MSTCVLLPLPSLFHPSIPSLWFLYEVILLYGLQLVSSLQPTAKDFSMTGRKRYSRRKAVQRRAPTSWIWAVKDIDCPPFTNHQKRQFKAAFGSSAFLVSIMPVSTCKLPELQHKHADADWTVRGTHENCECFCSYSVTYRLANDQSPQKKQKAYMAQIWSWGRKQYSDSSRFQLYSLNHKRSNLWHVS